MNLRTLPNSSSALFEVASPSAATVEVISTDIAAKTIAATERDKTSSRD